MEHLSILIWIKVHYTGIQNRRFWNLQILKQLIKKKYNFKRFWKGKNNKDPCGIRSRDLKIHS